jgi:hydroxyacylglutathione hydrolase
MLKIITIPVTSYQQNARVLVDETKNEGVLVDPGGDVDAILSACSPAITFTAIWITHSHIDHVSGVSDILTMFPGLPVLAHAEDSVNRNHLKLQSEMMSFPYSGDFDTTRDILHDDVLTIGASRWRVLHTPGHAIGHLSFFMASSDNSLNAPVLIAGDALFKGSIGRTDLPGGNHNQLLDSIRRHIFTLPGHTVVCAGHGPETTVDAEMKTNPFFKST